MAKKAEAADVPVEAPVEVPVDYTKLIAVEGAGYVEHPQAGEKPFRLNLGGQNYEHVSEDEHGVWVYRPM